MKKRVTAHDGNFARTFSMEDGQGYRGVHQDMAPVLKHVKKMNDMQGYRTNKGGMAEKYAGSIPKSMLTAWLRENNVTAQDWATNAGGDPYNKYPGGPGVYDRFMAYMYSENPMFMAERKKSSQILMPNALSAGVKRENTRNARDSH